MLHKGQPVISPECLPCHDEGRHSERSVFDGAIEHRLVLGNDLGCFKSREELRPYHPDLTRKLAECIS